MIRRPDLLDPGVVHHKKQHRPITLLHLSHQFPQVFLTALGDGVREITFPAFRQRECINVYAWLVDSSIFSFDVASSSTPACDGSC